MVMNYYGMMNTIKNVNKIDQLNYNAQEIKF